MTTINNPHLLKPGYVRIQNRAASTKSYRAVFTWHGGARYTRRVWQTATEADAYSRRLRDRWCRLYDAAIIVMMPAREPQP